MDVILTIFGLIAGIAVFLYFVNALDAGKRALVKKETVDRSQIALPPSGGMPFSGNVPPSQSSVQSGGIPADLRDYMPSRTCPLCSSILTRDEPLYATHLGMGKDRKILIHGCPYCYKSEKKETL